MFRRLWGAAAQSFDNRTHLLLRVVNVVHAVWDMPSFCAVEHLRPGRRFGKDLRREVAALLQWGIDQITHFETDKHEY